MASQVLLYSTSNSWWYFYQQQKLPGPPSTAAKFWRFCMFLLSFDVYITMCLYYTGPRFSSHPKGYMLHAETLKAGGWLLPESRSELCSLLAESAMASPLDHTLSFIIKYLIFVVHLSLLLLYFFVCIPQPPPHPRFRQCRVMQHKQPVFHMCTEECTACPVYKSSITHHSGSRTVKFSNRI